MKSKISVSLETANILRAEELLNRNEFKNLSQLMDTALKEYLNNHE